MSKNKPQPRTRIFKTDKSKTAMGQRDIPGKPPEYWVTDPSEGRPFFTIHAKLDLERGKKIIHPQLAPITFCCCGTGDYEDEILVCHKGTVHKALVPISGSDDPLEGMWTLCGIVPKIRRDWTEVVDIEVTCRRCLK